MQANSDKACLRSFAWCLCLQGAGRSVRCAAACQVAGRPGRGHYCLIQPCTPHQLAGAA